MRGYIKKLMVMVFALMTALTFMAGGALAVDEVTVDPWFVEKIVDNEAVLAPGTTTYCNKDFEVENLGEDMAEVHIIRGSGDNYDMDRIPSGGKLAYKLQDRSIFATDASEGNWVDEARIVNSTMGSSRLKIYCK